MSINFSKRITRTIEEYEHLFYLASHDVIFFSTYNEDISDWDEGWYAVVNCNDTFYYACADAKSIAPGREYEVRELFEKYGWSGVVAWCSQERDWLEPIKERLDENYYNAVQELKDRSNK